MTTTHPIENDIDKRDFIITSESEVRMVVELYKLDARTICKP